MTMMMMMMMHHDEDETNYNSANFKATTSRFCMVIDINEMYRMMMTMMMIIMMIKMIDEISRWTLALVI